MTDQKAQRKAPAPREYGGSGPETAPGGKAPTAQPATATAKLPEKGKKPLLVGVMVALVLIVAAYGGGRLQGYLGIREVRGELEAMRGELSRLDRLEARRHLHLAIRESEVANFGNAQKHVVAAARLLDASRPGEGSALHTLATAVSQTRLVPAADFSEQRALLVSYVAKLDELVPPRAQAMTPSKD